ncbi:hypothetical protein [Streptomyces sp. NRRL S-241]|uniref:hypothetical protein n=1 Tax=Streptomyces sp. NRRL S-241 TaxID=1463896 RepID=UPI0007C43BAB|nr:hypothetical protein [Streptomyces sp. NRRL S-241]
MDQEDQDRAQEQELDRARAAPLVRDALPALAAELARLLEEEGERELAICAHDLRIIADCGCGDDFCQSFYTERRPTGPYGPGHRNVPLFADRGYLILDVVHGRIMFVEVLDRPELRPALTAALAPSPAPARAAAGAGASPGPVVGAEGEHPGP